MPIPTEIRLLQTSKRLQISFDNGEVFALAYEYLRVFSPSAEVMGHAPSERQWPAGKAGVGMQSVHPIGHYAVQLVFDDGHNSGIYTWDYLYQLGQKQPDNWQSYLSALAARGLTRGDPDTVSP